MKLAFVFASVLCSTIFSQTVSAVSNEAIIQYAPIVKIHPTDDFLPSSVEFFLQYVHEENNYLVTNQKLRHPSDYSLPFFKGDVSTIPPVYAITVPKPNLGSDIYDVHYFFFFPYNRGKRVCVGKFISGIGCVGGYSTFGNHVGDWEGMRIRFQNDNILSLTLSAHDFSNEYSYSDFNKVNTHPIVYSASGSHGTYLKAGRFVYKKLPNDDLIDYTADGGYEWHTYNNVVIIPFHPVGEYPAEFSFLNFTGRWGNPKDSSKCVFGQCVLETGPSGPAMKAAVNPNAP